MTSKFITTLTLLTATLVACNKQPSESQPAPSAAEMSDEALNQAQIPVKEDFEEQAQAAITDENLDDQVSQLEAQIQNDK
jgi:hypothetical protein